MKRFTHPQMHPCLWSQAEGSHKDNIEKVGQFYDHFLPGKDLVHQSSPNHPPKPCKDTKSIVENERIQIWALSQFLSKDFNGKG
jgi:hypothetical protein